MKTLNKCILCFFCSLYSILAIAQVPQELLDKAKAAGMTRTDTAGNYQTFKQQRDETISNPGQRTTGNRPDHDNK